MSDTNSRPKRKAGDLGVFNAIQTVKKEETFGDELETQNSQFSTIDVTEQQQIHIEAVVIKDEVVTNETAQTIICLEDDDPKLSQSDTVDASGSEKYVKQRKIERKPRKIDCMKPGMTADERKAVFDRIHVINNTPFPHVLPEGGMAALPPPPMYGFNYETATTRVKCRPYGFMPNCDGQTDDETERTMKEYWNETIEEKFTTTSSQTDPVTANDICERSCQADFNKCDKGTQTE